MSYIITMSDMECSIIRFSISMQWSLELVPHCLVHALIYETSYIFVMANFWNLPLLMVHAPSTSNNGACTCFRDAPECGVIGYVRYASMNYAGHIDIIYLGFISGKMSAECGSSQY